jgi:hypothetical protein
MEILKKLSYDTRKWNVIFSVKAPTLDDWLCKKSYGCHLVEKQIHAKEHLLYKLYLPYHVLPIIW